MGMAESEMCLPYVIDELRHTVDELHESHAELASTQELLMHTERPATVDTPAAMVTSDVFLSTPPRTWAHMAMVAFASPAISCWLSD